MQDDIEEFSVPFCEEEVKILYQDTHLLLVNKPSGLLTVPGRLPQNKDCLITRVQQNFPRATICHRLDMDTSGIMLVPLCHAVHADITRQFMRREISKTYTAIVWGDISENGSVDLPIVFDWDNRPRQKICHDTGKPSLTHYEILERLGDRTRLLLKPVTGRSHQLRIHCRELGHPILGDDLYAHAEARALSTRLCLHSTTLNFIHPITGEPMAWRCEPEF